jgi:hypothetical protein
MALLETSKVLTGQFEQNLPGSESVEVPSNKWQGNELFYDDGSLSNADIRRQFLQVVSNLELANQLPSYWMGYRRGF